MTVKVPAFLGPLLVIGTTRAEVADLDFLDADLAPGNVLDIVMPQQQLSNWCWAATTASVQAYYQEPGAKSQCEVASYWLGVPCCPPGLDVPSNPRNQRYNLATTLDRNLAAAPIGNAIPPAVLMQTIVGRHPICCAIRWSNGDMHFNVIAGYIPELGDVIVRDPKYGEHQIPYEQLRTHYANDGQWIATLLTKKA